MLRRALVSVILFAMGTATARADDAPCAALVQFLQNYAQRLTPSEIGEQSFEFLRTALGDSEDPTLARSRDVDISILPVRSFDTLNGALSAVADISLTEAPKQDFEDIGLEAEGWRTDLTDFRPYSPHVMISQSQGTMHCDFAVVFRAGESPKVSSVSEGDACWTAHLEAIRIHDSAFPIIWEVASAPGELSDHLYLLNPDRPLSQDQAFCTVDVEFSPTTIIDRWYPSNDIDPAFLARLRAVIEPIVTGKVEAEPVLKQLVPTAAGNTAYDDFIRAPDRTAEDVLNALDPEGISFEIPNAEDDGYTELRDELWPIQLDDHRLVMKFGQPTFGWRIFDDNAFGVWEWREGKLIPIVGGYTTKIEGKPVAIH